MVFPSVKLVDEDGRVVRLKAEPRALTAVVVFKPGEKGWRLGVWHIIPECTADGVASSRDGILARDVDPGRGRLQVDLETDDRPIDDDGFTADHDMLMRDVVDDALAQVLEVIQV